jgi:hypothetical protein
MICQIYRSLYRDDKILLRAALFVNITIKFRRVHLPDLI